MAHEGRYQAYYEAIENELDRRGLDYEIHGLPGAEDIIHFEEYWVTNIGEGTKLFPAIVDADQASDLDEKITAAVMAHQTAGDTSAYHVVLCGEGWTEERIAALRNKVELGQPPQISLRIESISAFTAGQ